MTVADHAQYSSASSQAKEWKTRSWRHFPKLVTLSVLGSMIAMAMAITVLAIADDSPIDSWPLAPTVYLSIITTLSNAMLRFAFSESSDLYWWSELLSPSGVSLPELHTMWDISHNMLSIAKFPTKQARQYLLRLTALLVVILAVNGPFLQRAVTVGFVTRVRTYEGTVPIRREPLWNLTTRLMGSSGHVYTSPPYQPEFADLASEMNLREPMALPSPVCRQNATCTANVTVAGFSWACADSEAPMFDIPTLDIAHQIVMRENGKSLVCKSLGYVKNETDVEERPGNDSQCRYFQSDFQLSVDPVFTGVLPDDEIPWKDKDLTPAMINYTSYLRADVESRMLAIRQCNFSTAFIELPIIITNESIVNFSPSSRDTKTSPARNRNEVEPIPFGWSRSSGGLLNNFVTWGFSQIMADMYAGYMLFDSQEGSHATLGLNVRQYINQSSIVKREQYANITAAQIGYEFSFHDPLDDFVTTLDETSLRYALKSIEESPDRLAELDLITESWAAEDLRDRARSMVSTSFSKDQNVQVSEEAVVAVYQAHYAFTTVAVSVTYIASLLTLLLLRKVFSSLGRNFSMSPLEIAKAFSAPVLTDVGSNAAADDIAKASTDVRVRYGEAKVERHSDSDSRLDGASWARGDASGVSEYSNMLGEVHQRRTLRIDGVDSVSKPESGQMYH